MTTFEIWLVVYFICLASLVWFYSLSLVMMNKQQPMPSRHGTEEITRVAILVPFFNEEKLMKWKVENLLRLNFEGLQYEVLFIDGGSSDRSLEILTSLTAGKENWKVLQSPQGGKIPQLNYALSRVSPDCEVVINTDMDADTGPEAIKHLLAHFSPDVGVTGALVKQENTISLDRSFWENQNQMRLFESRFYSCTSVVAPLYAFRKKIVRQLPDDCVADDVYITFLSNQAGLRSLYVPDIVVSELRGVSGWREYLLHKFRKGLANARETYRFISSPGGSGRWRFQFYNRAAQLTIMPFLFFTFLGMSLLFLISGDKSTYSSVALAGVFAGAAMMISPVRGKSGALHSLANLLIANLVLIAVHLSYPFVRQTSQYRKSR